MTSPWFIATDPEATDEPPGGRWLSMQPEQTHYHWRL